VTCMVQESSELVCCKRPTDRTESRIEHRGRTRQYVEVRCPSTVRDDGRSHHNAGRLLNHAGPLPQAGLCSSRPRTESRGLGARPSNPCSCAHYSGGLL